MGKRDSNSSSCTIPAPSDIQSRSWKRPEKGGNSPKPEAESTEELGADFAGIAGDLVGESMASLFSEPEEVKDLKPVNSPEAETRRRIRVHQAYQSGAKFNHDLVRNTFHLLADLFGQTWGHTRKT